MVDKEDRHRLVFLGAGGVGKSSIIKRFLFSTFSEQYRETVEDLFSKEFHIQGSLIKVDILDTAGKLAFPAMRRLSISNAHAFILVFSITRLETFEEIKQLWEQIKEERTNYQDIPCVIVGNKLDMEDNRQVEKFDALNWLYADGLSNAYVEVSAKEGDGVTDIFKTLLQQAKLPHLRKKEVDNQSQRRLSTNSVEQEETDKPVPEMEPESKKFSRSRSLIRRGSKPKVKRIGNQKKDDCIIS